MSVLAVGIISFACGMVCGCFLIALCKANGDDYEESNISNKQ